MQKLANKRFANVVPIGLALALGVCGALAFRAVRPAPAVERTDRATTTTALPEAPPPSGSLGARRPPALLSVAPGPKLQADPKGPDYDVLKLAQVAEMGFDQIHAAEPRDSTWAPAMETRVGEIARKDFETAGIAGQVREINCKTMVCKVVLEAPDATSLTQARRLFEISNVATAFTMGGKERGPGESIGLYVAFDRQWRDLDKNAEVYPAFRKMKIDRLRTMHAGKTPAPDEPPIPVE
jgi:hypothetical protein